MLIEEGHDAVHPRDLGRLRDADHVVLRRAIEEDRIIITENGRDFLRLLRAVEMHPGLVVLPNVSRGEGRRLIAHAVAHILAGGSARPEDGMINRILEVSRKGAIETWTEPRL
jgi:predicted nuclease of predicted toxin-antitoxin system